MTSKRRKEIRRRRRARNANKLTQWFRRMSAPKKILLFSAVILLCLAVAAIIYVSISLGKINKQKINRDDVVINEELDESIGKGYTNFYLFGGDSRSGDVTKNLNTDTIIIASLNNATKEVKLVSVYRDTLLDISNGKIKKCNSAYPTGGATMAIKMLNMNLDLNITDYVTVNFGAVVELVDMLGGIEVNVTKKEYKEVNKYIDETAKVTGKKAKYLTREGLQTLDGVQATTYARIRKNVGNDYARTERQRLVIQKIVEKAAKSDLATINNIINTILPEIFTSFEDTEILSYAKDFAKYKITETSGFPFEKGSGKIPGKGDSVYPITLESNVSQLHKFLFGTEDYQPTSTVVKISNEIAYIVRNKKPDTGSSDTGSDDKDTTDDPTTDDPTTDDPTTDDPTTDDPTTDDPTTDDPTTDDPTIDDPTTDDPTTDDPTTDDPTTDDPTTDDPTTDDPTTDDPTIDDPTTDIPTEEVGPNVG